MHAKLSEWRKRYFALTMNPRVLKNSIEEARDLLDDAWNLLVCYHHKHYPNQTKKMKNKKVLKHLKHDIQESKKSIKEDKILAKAIKAKKNK